MMLFLQYLYILIGLVLTAYSVSLLLNVIVFTRMKNRTYPAKPEISTWPYVTIELPFYNEHLVVDRVLEAVVRLDYPRDKLQIIILDDSTDETSQRIDNFLASHGHQDLDIVVMRRKQRENYKTGALRESMRLVKGEIIGVFDADFVPPANFLKETVPYFSMNERLGFIQTRWGYINATESLMTIAQSISLDIHFAIEKIVEQKMGMFINYNGSAGLWRKAAVEDCGGWPHDALSEDLELSYRAQSLGWLPLYLPNVMVPSELISSAYLLGMQQERWAFGGLEVLRNLWRPIIGSGISFSRKFHALSILSGYLLFVLFLLQPLLFLFLRYRLVPVAAWPLSLAVLLTILVNAIAAVIALKKTYNDWLYRAVWVPLHILVVFGFSVRVGWGAIKGLLGMKHEFVRTPKTGQHRSVDAKDIPISRPAPRKWLGFILVEALLSALMVYGAFFTLQYGTQLTSVVTSIVLFLLGIGYSLVAALTLADPVIRKQR